MTALLLLETKAVPKAVRSNSMQAPQIRTLPKVFVWFCTCYKVTGSWGHLGLPGASI